MDQEFKAGDVVQLKSGGPKMTIDTIAKFGMGSTHDQAKCVWFEGTKRMEALFELPTLSNASTGIAFGPMSRE
jgi:uncharacterized protein YodC (DUF2158 family)